MVNRLQKDERGIALQTIIIMVVLLAIAGAVAAVLLTRAGTEADRLEDADTQRFANITNETGCTIAGGTWSGSTCGAPSGNVVVTSPNPPFADRMTQAGCVMETPFGSGVGTWTDRDTDDDQDPTTMPDDGTCS